jgi:hypothetical protein
MVIEARAFISASAVTKLPFTCRREGLLGSFPDHMLKGKAGWNGSQRNTQWTQKLYFIFYHSCVLAMNLYETLHCRGSFESLRVAYKTSGKLQFFVTAGICLYKIACTMNNNASSSITDIIFSIVQQAAR